MSGAFVGSALTSFSRNSFTAGAACVRPASLALAVPCRARFTSATPARIAMAITVGDSLPTDHTLGVIGSDGKPAEVSVDDVFKGKKVGLFALPGAFTPTCSDSHLPSYVEKEAELKAKGIDTIACLSTNDAFVNRSWAKAQNAEGKIMMLSDGDASFVKDIGLVLDTGKFGGIRSARFSAVVVDGQVVKLNVDASGYEKTSAETMLADLNAGVEPLVQYCADNPDADECKTYDS